MTEMTSRERVEQALARIADPAGEGARAFTKVYADTARAEADHSDRLRRAGIVRSPVDGLPVSVKDLFDVGGDVTRAGSKILATAAPAQRDAARRGATARGRRGHRRPHEHGRVRVRRRRRKSTLRHAEKSIRSWRRSRPGRLVIGSGGRRRRRHVCDGARQRYARIGARAGRVVRRHRIQTDRAARAARRRVSVVVHARLGGTDRQVGRGLRRVRCSARGRGAAGADAARAARGLRLLLPRSSVLDDLEPAVADAFAAALTTLRDVGALVVEVPMPAFDRQADYFRAGGFAGAEAYSIHQARLDRLDEYDPRVGKRIALGGDLSAADYVELGATARPIHPRSRIDRRAVRRDADADRPVHRADDRGSHRDRRRLLSLERTHPAQRWIDQFSRRLRGLVAVSSTWNGAGRFVGVRRRDERRHTLAVALRDRDGTSENLNGYIEEREIRCAQR